MGWLRVSLTRVGSGDIRFGLRFDLVEVSQRRKRSWEKIVTGQSPRNVSEKIYPEICGIEIMIISGLCKRDYYRYV